MSDPFDFNPCAVAANFLELVKQEFPNYEFSKATFEEVLLLKQLLKIFKDMCTEFVFQEQEEVYDDFSNEPLTTSEANSEGSSWSQEERYLFDEAGNVIEDRQMDDCTLARKIEILKLIEAHPNWSLATIQGRNCKEFKHFYYKKRWEEQILAGGTIFEKYQKIDEHTYEKYQEARKEFKFVDDIDLKMWGLQIAQTFKDENFVFKTCSTWVASFKLRHKIKSRKVVKLVSKREVRSKCEIMDATKRFQTDFKCLSKNFNGANIYNTDQVGFNYELVSGRTLSNQGEKSTFAFAKSPKNLVTRSYTVQYTINMEGEICGNVFLCLQEQAGRLSPKVQSQLFKAKNVTLTCSTSGKLTTSLYEYYLDNVLMNIVCNDFLLVIDSWPGQTNALLYAEGFGIDEVPNCTLKIIPENCTAFCQPLDTTFNRQIKYFARQIHHHATLHHTSNLAKSDEVTTRNNIIKMHSLIHHQLSAPIFNGMIKYSWFPSNLTEDCNLYSSVQEVCFTFKSNEPLKCQITQGRHGPPYNGTRFVKCSRCRLNICFDCFFYDYHMC